MSVKNHFKLRKTYAIQWHTEKLQQMGKGGGFTSTAVMTEFCTQFSFLFKKNLGS